MLKKKIKFIPGKLYKVVLPIYMWPVCDTDSPYFTGGDLDLQSILLCVSVDKYFVKFLHKENIVYTRTSWCKNKVIRL